MQYGLVKTYRASLAAAEIIEECQGKLRARSELSLEAVQDAAKNPGEHSAEVIEKESAQLAGCTFSLQRTDSILLELLRFGDGNKTRTKTVRLAMSKLTLVDGHGRLHDESEGLERLIILTGPVLGDGTRVLSNFCEVKLKEQSRTYVLADPEDWNRKITLLTEKHGHEPHVVAHSHIGKGAELAQPSPVDIAAQKRIEALGGRSIGLIVTTDHHYSFFSIAIPFEISITGHGIALLSSTPWRKLFRLEMEGV